MFDSICTKVQNIKKNQGYRPILTGLTSIWTNSGNTIILEAVLKNLDFKSVASLRLASKSCKNYTDESKTWWVLIIQHLLGSKWKLSVPQQNCQRKIYSHTFHECLCSESLSQWQKLIKFIEKHTDKYVLKELAFMIHSFINREDIKVPPFLYFCHEKFHPFIKTLFEKGFDLNCYMPGPEPGPDGDVPPSKTILPPWSWSFLHRAVTVGNLKSVVMVLENTDTESLKKMMFDMFSRTPFHLAGENYQPLIVDYLMENGPKFGINLNARDGNGKNALNSVCSPFGYHFHHWRSQDAVRVIKTILDSAEEKAIGQVSY